MSLKSKIFFIITGVFISCGILSYFIQKSVVLPSFIELENEQVHKDMKRIHQAIRKEIDNVDALCKDWSSWDDAYEFVKTSSPHFIKTNLADSTFTNNNLNLIYYLNASGKIVWGQVYEPELMVVVNLPEFPLHRFPKNHPLINLQDNHPVSGIWMTSLGPMLISSRSVLTSDNTGPSTGYLIMGRFLTKKMEEALNRQTQVQFQIISASNNSLMEIAGGVPLLFPEKLPFEVDNAGASTLIVSASYPDITGKPALKIAAEIPRSVLIKGNQSVRTSLWIIFAGGVIALVSLILMLQRTAIRPLMLLTSQAESIAQSQDMSVRLAMERKDEIGSLGMAFNKMMDKLEQSMSRVRDSEEMFRLMTEYSLAQISIILDGNFIYVNPAMSSSCGYLPEEMIGMKSLHLVHPEDRSLVLRRTMNQLTSLESVYDNYNFRYITKTGETRWLELMSVPILYHKKKAILGHGIDITERVRTQEEKSILEERIRLSEKMETIGMLAGGVAHDLNNILSGIVSYPDLLLMGLTDDSPMKKPLMTIKQSGLRATAIVQDLLALARRGVVFQQVVSLNLVVGEYMSSPEFEKLKSFNPGMEIKTELSEKLFNIKGSAPHLFRMIMNLVNNAAEASSKSDVVTICTKNHYLENSLEHLAPGEYVMLTVSDTGTGISQEDIARIFEPFYTKKVMGRSGTGLGMALVCGTVKDHNGHIYVESTLGKGTVFTLYFPAVREGLVDMNTKILTETHPGRGEKILIVDDVLVQREIASEILKKLGYSVDSVPSGEEAVEFVKTQNVDLLLLDMIMEPGISGLETYRQIIAHKRLQKAIIVSGYSKTDEVSEALRLGAGRYLKKPYVLEELAEAVHAELKR